MKLAGIEPPVSVKLTEIGNVPVGGVPERLVPAPVAEVSDSQDGPERVQL